MRDTSSSSLKPGSRDERGRRIGAILAVGLWAAAAPALAQNPPPPDAAAPTNTVPPAAEAAPAAAAASGQTPPADTKAAPPAATAPVSPTAPSSAAPPAAPASTAPAGVTPPAAAPAVAPIPSSAEAPRPIAQPIKHSGELSAWSMFMDADILVKAVMLGLAFASVLTWTIFLGKSAELMLAQARLRKAVRRLDECGSLTEAQLMLGNQRGVAASLVRQAVQEVRLSSDIRGEEGLKERVASRFAETQKTEGRNIRRGMGILATIGSTSPFVGLFGTVWGIMNSFIGIAKSQTTNLAVVAPGIAEALLATAIGLVAAIPAVIVYNHFARATKGYLDGVGRASGAVGRILSRDLDRAHGTPHARAQAAE